MPEQKNSYRNAAKYYLKNAAIRRELRSGEIVASSYARHFQLFLFYSSESVREFFILEYFLKEYHSWQFLDIFLECSSLRFVVSHRPAIQTQVFVKVPIGLIRNSLKETMSENVF
jgi:hypothetical protein